MYIPINDGRSIHCRQVYTFLESYDVQGKTILFFCTHAGSGISDTQSGIQSTCPHAGVLRGFAIKGETAQEDYDETKRQVMKGKECIFESKG